METISIS